MCQHLTAGMQAETFVVFALRTRGFSGPRLFKGCQNLYCKPHGTMQQCLCGVDPMAAFQFLQPLRQSDDDFKMRKTSPFSNIFLK